MCTSKFGFSVTCMHVYHVFICASHSLCGPSTAHHSLACELFSAYLTYHVLFMSSAHHFLAVQVLSSYLAYHVLTFHSHMRSCPTPLAHISRASCTSWTSAHVPSPHRRRSKRANLSIENVATCSDYVYVYFQHTHAYLNAHVYTYKYVRM